MPMRIRLDRVYEERESLERRKTFYETMQNTSYTTRCVRCIECKQPAFNIRRRTGSTPSYIVVAVVEVVVVGTVIIIFFRFLFGVAVVFFPLS